MADIHEPAFPVPVVRLITTDGEGRVLLLKRADSKYAAGSWCLPGGKIDYGETAEGAAAKELREETSLVLTSCNFLFFQDSLPPRDGDMHCLNLYFECEASGTVSLSKHPGP